MESSHEKHLSGQHIEINFVDGQYQAIHVEQHFGSLTSTNTRRRYQRRRLISSLLLSGQELAAVNNRFSEIVTKIGAITGALVDAIYRRQNPQGRKKKAPYRFKLEREGVLAALVLLAFANGIYDSSGPVTISSGGAQEGQIPLESVMSRPLLVSKRTGIKHPPSITETLEERLKVQPLSVPLPEIIDNNGEAEEEFFSGVDAAILLLERTEQFIPQAVPLE